MSEELDAPNPCVRAELLRRIGLTDVLSPRGLTAQSKSVPQLQVKDIFAKMNVISRTKAVANAAHRG